MEDKPGIDKTLLAMIPLVLAVLAGGVAWGVNSTKIDHNKTSTIELKDSLGVRIRRMEARTDRRFDKVETRFDKLDKKLQAILRAVRRK